jgi:hypothetical protein
MNADSDRGERALDRVLSGDGIAAQYIEQATDRVANLQD